MDPHLQSEFGLWVWLASRRWFARRGRLGLFMTFNTTMMASCISGQPAEGAL